eukprot:INCI10017.1.p1 GENE.INCI10017.1~~INCI10017.1.p1  ORF type:complete len:506 (-),score=119.02 INCI10017.1:1580-3097(-)
MPATISSRSVEIREAMARILARRAELAESRATSSGAAADAASAKEDQALSEEEARLQDELDTIQQTQKRKVGGSGGLPPAHITGGIEPPQGEKNNGSFTTRVYTAEQQARLGVDENGDPAQVTEPRLQAQSSVGGPQSLPSSTQALPPAWLTGDIEKPAGEKNHGSYTTLVYTEEQQQRLGVDEFGNKVDAEEAAAAAPKQKAKALPPAWLSGAIEKPAGERKHGSHTTLYYTEEQQVRLGVDEEGHAVKRQALPPAWIAGGLEKPAGEKHHGSYTTLVYTEEQQKRLGVDEHGNKVDAPAAMKALPPKWLSGEIEKPAGERDNGGWTSLYYTAEQQERLGVDENGNKVVRHQALPPPWLSNGLERPAGEKHHGSYTTLVYTEEQQKRLGVDEVGNKVENSEKRKALPPAWLSGGIEKPAGEKDHGTHTSLVYTEEQQARLGVDENGQKVASQGAAKKALPPAWLTGGIEKPAGEKHHGTFTTLVYTPEQQARLGVDEAGNKVSN